MTAKRFKHVHEEADAAVLGIGCCPGCTPAVVVNQLEMESAYGLPAGLRRRERVLVVQSTEYGRGTDRAEVTEPVPGLQK
jgi:hypothetical protein